jgi:3-hydroxymyristoyl/3-hydroxydecanoyl-(acyl carrier protein) dehydratase
MLMEHKLSSSIVGCYESACKASMIASPSSKNPLTKAEIMTLMPSKPPYLFIDRVIYSDNETHSIVATFTVQDDDQTFAGHLPRNPLFPGMLQVEAISQVGLLQALIEKGTTKSDRNAVTHLCGGRFLAPIIPPKSVYINVTLFWESLFYTAVGQIVNNQEVCAAAIVRGLI